MYTYLQSSDVEMLMHKFKCRVVFRLFCCKCQKKKGEEEEEKGEEKDAVLLKLVEIFDFSLCGSSCCCRQEGEAP